MTGAPARPPAPVRGPLGLDDDDLARCVSCGLCLAHCPTFRATGEEARSPRGRIAAMRAVTNGAPADDSFAEILGSCVMCRACETACPSAVPFGRLMEGSRRAISRRVPWWQRVAYRTLEHPKILAALTTAGAVSQRAHLLPPVLGRRLGLPDRLPVRNQALTPTGTDVWLFTGCVMDAWLRDVHRDTVSVLGAMGVGVGLPLAGAGCCGALHAHAGLTSRAEEIARRVMAALPGSAPVLVDSAGCGATLKEYGELLGTPEARAFTARVYDVCEWIAAHADRLPPVAAGSGDWRIAVQDPCHLRHVQRAESHVRTVLRPYGTLLELGDEGRCCGAGGAFSVLRPALAGVIRDQKTAAIDAVGPDVVASANPGCALWLAGAGLRVMHPMEIVARRAGLRR